MVRFSLHIGLGTELGAIPKREEVDVYMRNIDSHNLFAHIWPVHNVADS